MGTTKKIIVHLRLTRFEAEDKQTCSIGTRQEETCKMLRFTNFGLVPYCAYAEKELKRRGDLGYIIPDDQCPLKDLGITEI